MKKTIQWVIVAGIMMVTFLLPAFLYKVSDLKNGTNTTQPKAVPNASSIKVEEGDFDELRFASIPPSIAISGGEFMYQVNLENFTGKPASLSIVSKPDWLSWNEESFLLSGTVPVNSSAFTVRFSASAVGNSAVEQSFTVSIEDDETATSNSDVKGVRDSSWQDPFHPENTDINASILDLETDSAVLGASITSAEIEDESSRWVVAGGVTATALVIYGIWLLFTNEKNQFLRGTGRLIVERGKKR